MYESILWIIFTFKRGINVIHHKEIYFGIDNSSTGLDTDVVEKIRG